MSLTLHKIPNFHVNFFGVKIWIKRTLSSVSGKASKSPWKLHDSTQFHIGKLGEFIVFYEVFRGITVIYFSLIVIDLSYVSGLQIY